MTKLSTNSGLMAALFDFLLFSLWLLFSSPCFSAAYAAAIVDRN